MNLLLVYLNKLWSPPFYLEKALKKKYEVCVFDFAKTPYWGDLRFKLPFYIPKGFPVSIQSVLKKFNNPALARKSGIELIIEVTTAGQYHLTGYKEFRKQNPGVKIILWASDVYRYDQRKFMLWMKNDFDFIFTTQKNFVDIFCSHLQSPLTLNLPSPLEGEGKRMRGFWLPYAADTEVHKKFNLPKIYDIVFVGNTNPKIYSERVRLLKLIGEKYNLKVFSGVYGEDLAMIYSQAKIVFNKSAAGEINMRVFEALSCGSLLLTDKLKPETGLEELFQDKKHLVLYENEKDLLEKIGYYLKHESEREEIALCGHKEILAKHTYEHRADEMLETITCDW